MSSVHWDLEFKKTKQAAKLLRQAGRDPDLKNRVLRDVATRLRGDTVKVLQENAKDLAALKSKDDLAFLDRLKLTAERIEAMACGLEFVANLPDPVGEVAEAFALKNGLAVKKVRAPLGVILMIFESRPNVVAEAFSLAFKSSNGLILRGGKESTSTCACLYELIGASLQSLAPEYASAFKGVVGESREWVKMALSQKDQIDVVVPRGGEGLIQFVVEHSRIPIIKNDRGMCHIYIHEDAELSMAAQIVVNAKTQRPGVCNALETLIVHQKIAMQFLTELSAHPSMSAVQFMLDPKLDGQTILTGDRFQVLTGDDDVAWDTEYLKLVLNVKQVDSLAAAIAHIDQHGSKHSEAIITKSMPVARQFQAEVDAAVVYWNASTRFTDGGELGLGGELGISTQKLHVRGPVGLKELTSERWIIDGEGQVRK